MPDNIFAALAHGQVLPVVFFSLLFGIALVLVDRPGPAGAHSHVDVARDLFDTIARTTYVMLGWVMLYAPIGTFALTAVLVGTNNLQAVGRFGWLLLAVYAGQVIVCAGCAFLLYMNRIGLNAFFSGSRDALLTAFVTGSSAATLPVELAAAEHNLKLDKPVFAFSLPLGVGIHKVGTAVNLAVISIFAAHVAGVPLTPERTVLLTVLAFVAAVGTPPISGGGFLMLGFIFREGGLPMELIAVLVAIPFVGKFNTPLNSLGRLTTTAILSKSVTSTEQTGVTP